MRYGLIGEKLGHSFSKIIHNALFDYPYELCEVNRENFKEFMEKREFEAINVTIPHKEMVIPFLSHISDEAKEIGAVNTIINKNGELYGYNTDFLGLKCLILKNEIDFKNKKVLILGSGGTSKTAFAVSKNLGAAEILRVSRKKENGLITYDEMYKEHCDADIIINTTPLGMYPDIKGCAAILERFKKLYAVVDVIYNPIKTELVTRAEQMGVKAVGGLYMLVAQAAFAAEKFTQKSVDKNKIQEIYNKILLSKQNVVLIGMPGSGKTTIGKLLSKLLLKEFVDSDEEIVKNSKMSIPEIFERFGEEHFRKLETEVLENLSKRQNLVIATGGGAVLNHKNVENLRKNGKIYFIDRNLESILPTDDRPLSSTRENLIKRYNERYEIYKKSADFHLKASDDANENADRIKEDFYNENTCN